MRLRNPLPSLVAICLAAGVACHPDDGGVTGSQPFPGSDELLAADQAFAIDASARGGEAWAAIWADEGMLYRDGESLAVGPDEVKRAMTGIAGGLRRQPAEAAMIWPDSLGYTVGYRWMSPNAPVLTADAPRYLTVWQRAGKEWKMALDLLLPPRNQNGAAHDFDFWLGDWTLEQRIWTGERDAFERYRAQNRVRAVDGGGALIESFEGDVRFFWASMEQPSRIRGASVRVYDAGNAQWRIFWIDTLDGKFGPPFNGAFLEGTGEFLKHDPAGATPPTRIRFMPRPDGTVAWDLALRTPETWQPLWTIEFRRR